MSRFGYERVPTSPNLADEEHDLHADLDSEERNVATERVHPAIRAAMNAPRDPRFDLPTPPTWQRAGLLVFILLLLWLLYRLRMSGLPPLE
ncbi:hypothetical protein SCHPADRAFT_905698 [Schizopora paradoxa]|uniref:Uncharacterized protein n=1 Tax=Schizopora paradoxa TaxID=27342 RepID=A0A0H2S4F1_9AGAM|nr:hypothetical protein SCHPADRAFT_905698 [Schizopora paradoxa]